MKESTPDYVYSREYLESISPYQGNWDVLCFERWRTADNIAKLASLYYDHLTTVGLEDKKMAYLALPFANTYFRNVLEQDENWKQVTTDGLLFKRVQQLVISSRAIEDMILYRSREECESFFRKKLREALELIFSITLISDSTENFIGWGSPGFPGEIRLPDENPLTGERFTLHELGAISAHEKGHGFRYFEGDSVVVRKILSAFDSNKIRNQLALNYEYRAIELLERMSQLKNFYGMSGSEEFTREHLEFAREKIQHEKVLGEFFSVQMSTFFSMITPQTTERFLELMNTLPV